MSFPVNFDKPSPAWKDAGALWVCGKDRSRRYLCKTCGRQWVAYARGTAPITHADDCAVTAEARARTLAEVERHAAIVIAARRRMAALDWTSLDEGVLLAIARLVPQP